ncbi:MAG: 30S ribosome-binding factor RbfA [Acidobacteriota bacterium]|nr:30S ribosome-binding factor RbfA [Acidobacteriota bacterium]
MPNRSDVLAEQIRQVISEAVLFEMRDPNLEGITITRVRVSSDLQFADVRFTPQDDVRDPQTVGRALGKAGGAFRRLLAKKIRMRRVPQLRFHYDADVTAERRIGDILESMDIPTADQEDDAT